jgi:APA family basic amino acid/polyamine antiporter
MGSLKRVLGFWDSVFITLASIIGAGIFAVVGVASGMSGPALAISMIIAGIVSIFVGLTFAELGEIIPKEGGVFEFGEELISPFAGFLGGWLYVFASIVSVSALGIALAGYLVVFLNFNVPVSILAPVIILIGSLLNLLNLKTSAKINLVFVLIVIAILLVFSVIGLSNFNPANFSNFAPYGFTGILGGAGLVFFDFLGFNKITTMGAEVKNPKKTIPRAMIFSILVVVLLYVLVSVSAISLGGSSIYNSQAPLSVAVSRFGPWAVLLISIGAVIAMFQVLFTSIMGGARVMFAMASKNFIPKLLGDLNSNNSPVHSIAMMMIISISLALTGNLVFVVSATSFSSLLYFVIGGAAALKVKKNIFPKWIPALSILFSVGLLFFLDFNAWIISFIVIVLAVLYWVWHKPKLIKRRAAV